MLKTYPAINLITHLHLNERKFTYTFYRCSILRSIWGSTPVESDIDRLPNDLKINIGHLLAVSTKLKRLISPHVYHVDVALTFDIMTSKAKGSLYWPSTETINSIRPT
jgi:hypothetical protein